MSHWFFLSYARTNNLDGYLKKFYKDLNETIRSLTTPEEGEDGFFDTQDIELGQPWREELTAALQTCRTFVSLYSPAYFTREICGQEWQIFSRRQAAYSANLPAHASRPSLILPVLWVPEASLPSPLPDVVSEVQYKHGDFGEVYAREGLRHLMALGSKYRTHYREFLKHFADKLIKAARAHSVPPLQPPPPMDDIESAFRRRGPGPSKPTGGAANGGPGFVQFISVAGRRDELQPVREKLDPYGEQGGYDWYPYLPEVKERVGLILQWVASTEGLLVKFVPFERDIIRRIEAAEQQNNIVVIIVDTWTLRLAQYHLPMSEYDGCRLLNSAVLVCWNNRDEELTEEKRTELEDWLKATFHRNFIEHNPNSFLEVNSHDELIKELPTLLSKARKRISERAEVMRRVGGGAIISKPIITGVRRASA